MAGANESSIPKFGSFQPKKRVNTPGVSKSSNSNGSSREREVMLGSHRVEKRPVRDHGRNSNERRHDVRTSSTSEPRPRQQTVDSYRPRHHEKIPHRDGRARPERTYRDSSESDSYNHGPDIYTIDTRGDPANLQYRRPNKWTVPLYHLYGSGSILGLDPEIKIDRRLSDERGYTLTYPPKRNVQKVIEVTETGDAYEPATCVDKDFEVESKSSEASEVNQADFLQMPKQTHDEGWSKESRSLFAV